MIKKNSLKKFLNYAFFLKILIFFFNWKVKIRNKIIFDLSYFINFFFFNLKLFLYNGLNLKKMKFSIFEINYKLGEFLFTRRFFKFLKNKNLKKR